MKITFIGHLCVDENVIRGQTEHAFGGGVFHGGITAQRLRAGATVMTKCAERDRPGFRLLDEAGVRVIFRPTPTSTSIRNVYPSENPDDRQSFLISRAAPFSQEDLDQVTALKADVVHVNPLWLGEFPLTLLAALRPSVAMLCADAQGFLRVAEPDGRLAHRDLPQKRDVLPLLDLFKVDAKEALILTGEEDHRRAACAVHALGPKLVLLTHRDGVCVFDGREFHEAPFSGFTLEGRTGRGDTCTASFLVARGRGMDLAKAASFAAEVTSRKMQYRGPFRG
jgi:sugar/nucleoside kinase (ribokinase family)